MNFESHFVSHLILSNQLPSEMLASQLLAVTEKIQLTGLVLGVASIIGGLFLLNAHRAIYERGIDRCSSATEQRFEQGKLRRRSWVAVLMTSIGMMLAALFWVTEARALAIFVLMIVTQLLFILAIALVDMFFVSLRLATKPVAPPSKQEIETIIRKHRHRQSEKSSGSETTASSETKK